MQRLSNHLISSILFILIFMTIQSFAQLKLITNDKVISEGNIYKSESGELFTDAIVVNFKENVIDLSVGKQYATKSNIKAKHLSVTNMLNKIESEYSSYKLIKQIPSAQWGDTQRLNKTTGKEISIHEYSQLFTVKFDKPIPLEAILDEFKNLEEVEYVHQPISAYIQTTPPNDQYYIQNDQWYLNAISAEGAWDITTGSNNVKIGIIDYGTDQDHPDLVNKIDGGDGVEYTNVNGSNVYHGTWVAGIAGACTNNNGIGIASLGWNVELNTYGGGLPPQSSSSNLVADIVAASLNSDVINMSFGLYKYATLNDINEIYCCCSDPYKWVGSYIPFNYNEIEDAIQDAYNLGVVCISSAGNSSPNNPKTSDPENCDPSKVPFIDYPSAYSEVISVSGTDELDNFESDYNYGNFVDISGPSQNMKTTHFGGGYISKNGTSFAAPLVSALAGLIKSMDSGLSNNKVKEIIAETADKVGQFLYNSSGWNQYMGAGRINAHNALNVMSGKPHKPQYLKVAHSGGFSGHPQVTWFTNPVHPINSKFDTKRYKIYRSYNDNGYRSPWQYSATINHDPSISTHSYTDNEVITYLMPQSNIEWFYRVVAVSDYLNYESLPSDEDSVYGNGPIGKKNKNYNVSEIITEYKLFDNYPNPFNPSTIINYSLPEESIVTIKIYDVLGNEVETIVNAKKSTGMYSVEFNTSEFNKLSSGVYFYRIEAVSSKNLTNYFTKTKKMILLR